MIPGLGRSPGEGNDYSLQNSGLENSIDKGAWQAIVHGAARGQTYLNNFHFTGGPVVKDPPCKPCKVGNAGLIPDQGTKIPHAVGQLSLPVVTTKLVYSGVGKPISKLRK